MQNSLTNYRSFGLHVSTDLKLPFDVLSKELNPALSVQIVECHEGIQVPEDAFSNDSDWFWSKNTEGGETLIAWKDLCVFRIAPDGKHISYQLYRYAQDESIIHYLFTQVFSFILLRLGFESFHGTAIEVNGDAILFLGDCGFGKSTIAAKFISEGHQLISDDIALLQINEDSIGIKSGCSRLKLFPKTMDHFEFKHSVLSNMNHTTEKKILEIPRLEPLADELMLRRVYCLNNPFLTEDVQGIKIEMPSRSSMHLALVENTFNTIEASAARLRSQFQFISELVNASSFSLKNLSYKRDFSQIQKLYRRVLDDLVCG